MNKNAKSRETRTGLQVLQQQRALASLLLTLSLTGPLPNAAACTLWGVAGDRAEEQGTLVAKNRDWEPDHVQKTKIVIPQSGYRYFGLFAEGGNEPGLKGGVNIKGLTIVTATASSIPFSVRKNQPGKKGVLAEILSGYDSVDGVLAHRELFAHARAGFFLLADRTKLAMVEVALDGKFAVRTETHGAIVHTNHFLEETLCSANTRIGESSSTRLDRIKALMAETGAPVTVDQFRNMSADQHDGPNNSLWRTGEKVRTLATWIMKLPKQGPPTLYLKIANPAQAPEEKRYTLDAKFWEQ
jgi:isopenicillin-N N-acyltransferase like protein